METLKNAVGMGGTGGKEVEEPRSGERLEGSVAEPFDAGNREEQQEEEGVRDSNNTHHDTTPTKQTSPAANGGSWFPFSLRKSSSPEQQQQNPPTSPEEQTGQPPSTKDDMSSEQNPTVVAASAEGIDTGPTSPTKSPAATTQLRGSRASVAAPAGQRPFNPHPTNPGRIPTAGGVEVGARAAEERRKSVMSWDSKVDNGEGSSKMAQQENGGGGKPELKMPEWGGEGEGARESAKSTPTTTGSSAAEGKKERRGSRMGMFKEKLGFGRKS